MANEEQLAILRQGVEVWNKWREENPNVEIDLDESKLVGANLSGADLSGANLLGSVLTGVNLSGANLQGAFLWKCNLVSTNISNANLTKADLHEANLYDAQLRGTDLRKANLSAANLFQADLTRANLSGADFTAAILVRTKIDKAKISGSCVYGTSVWDLEGEFEAQKDLIITKDPNAVITVDNIKVAQFIYLILNNEEIREVINALTSKSVLILGRFALPERKAILDALRSKLREYNLLPIVFDFDRPTDKDFTETIKTLAGISYFVIADVTNPNHRRSNCRQQSLIIKFLLCQSFRKGRVPLR